MVLYTVGHSNHPIGRFLQLLAEHGIQCLVDVRSTPYSRFNPQFNRAGLQKALHLQGIEYAYLGAELGGRPKDPRCYIHHTLPAKGADYLHEINYAMVMQQPWFIQGIHQLVELAGLHTTAILCSEADPALCHRHHLIASYLLANQPALNVLHILKDSKVIDARSIPATDNQSSSNQPRF